MGTWCRPCKAFAPKYKVLSEWYTDTRFIKIVGNENESCKHYARDVLQAKISPMFAAYSKGELKHTWTGANWERFVYSVTEHLSSAGARERPQEPKAAELPVSNARAGLASPLPRAIHEYFLNESFLTRWIV